jgi:chromosome segregation protein
MALEGVTAELGRAQAGLGAADARKTQIGRDLAYAEATLNDAEAVDARLAAEAARLVGEAGGHPALLEAAQAEADQAAAALQRADAAASEAAAQASVAAAQTGAAQQLLVQAEARHRRATESLARLTAERQQAEDRLIDAGQLVESRAAVVAAEAALGEAAAALAEAEGAYAEASRASVSAREAFNRDDTHRHRLAAEVAALAEVLAIKDGEKWPPMIDSLSVPPGLETALGAALGEELAAAANPDAARHWATLPALEPAPIPGARLSDQVSGPGLLARALQAIGLVQSDAEGAAAQAGLVPGQSVVSPSGGVWRWDGYTVRSGTPSAAALRLQQRNRLQRLQRQAGVAEAAAGSARAALDAALRAERDAGAALERCRQRQRQADGAAASARSAEQALRLRAEAAESRFKAVDEQLGQVSPEAAASAQALQAAREAVASQPNTAKLKADADQARAAVNAARQRDLAASRAVDSLQRAEQARQTRKVTIVREREDRRMQVADLGGRVADLRAREQDAAAELARLRALPDRVQQEAAKARERLTEAEASKREASAAHQAAEALCATMAAQARASEQASYAARETLLRAESAVGAAESALDVVLAQIAERESALPPLPAGPEVSAQAEDRARGRMNRLARERDEIGPVNLRAEIEAGAIEQEIATINRERDELGTAIAKLRGSIGHLNREGRERLAAIFQEVDRHFQALFSRMFGGGRAHLALVGSDDPLEAGLEIYAQPPGKKLSALSLLSGGEQALTALSLIFAVFRCNPAPLCILDEVDAPLDDANVGRFCALLTDMVQETGTRFLVVTHHQVTMAGMDRLYGVTMQERGVSRLLSVDLSGAVGMVEAIAAE